MTAVALILALAQIPESQILVRGSPMDAPGPQVVVAVAPVFPEGLRTTARGETIDVDVEVDSGGSVTRAIVVAGTAEPAQRAAVRAARNWLFRGAGTARLIMVFRDMPAGTPPEDLTTVFRGSYEMEVRRAVEADVADSRVLQEAGFVALPQRPSEDDLDCANRLPGWEVSTSEGGLQVVSRNQTEHVDPLPFTYPKGQDRVGDRHVVKVADGWLVGFDAGEFGGGLWWFDEKGRGSKRLRPLPDAPARPTDFFRAENVRGFAHYDGGVVVFMGLDHLGGRSGRVFRVVRAGKTWALEPLAVLEGSPDGWVVDRDRLLVLTGSGLWDASAGVATRRLHDLEVSTLYPSSLVSRAEGALYAGMRRYVVRLSPAASGWTETWFVQSNCVRAEITDFACACRP